MGLLFTGYRQVRYLTRNHTDAATSNAHRIVDLERHLGMFTERWVQNLALHSRAVIGFLNRYYVTVHFPLTALFVVWVLVRHRHAFRHVRTWLYVGDRRGARHPRRVSTRSATDARRAQVRRHAESVRPEDLQHRHHTVDRQPVCGNAVAAFRVGGDRRSRLRRDQTHPPQSDRLRSSRDHAGRNRRHRQPLLDGRRRRPRTHSGYGIHHPPDHELPVRPPDERARHTARRPETGAPRSFDLSTASGPHQQRSAL